MMGGYEGGYPQYHAGYEDRGGHGAGLQWPGGYHGHHHSGGSAGSPTQRYPYYDSRSGYYAHSVSSSQAVTADPGGGSWHEPVSGSRSESPGPGSGPGGYPAPPSNNMYSCKMQTPPSPQDTKVRQGREERQGSDNSEIFPDGGSGRSPSPVPGLHQLWAELEQQPPASTCPEQLQSGWTRPALASPTWRTSGRAWLCPSAVTSLPLDEEPVW